MFYKRVILWKQWLHQRTVKLSRRQVLGPHQEVSANGAPPVPLKHPQSSKMTLRVTTKSQSPAVWWRAGRLFTSLPRRLEQNQTVLCDCSSIAATNARRECLAKNFHTCSLNKISHLYETVNLILWYVTKNNNCMLRFPVSIAQRVNVGEFRSVL